MPVETVNYNVYIDAIIYYYYDQSNINYAIT